MNKSPQVYENQKANIQPGVEELTCHPSIQELRQENLKFKASLGYIGRSYLKKEKEKMGRGRKGEGRKGNGRKGRGKDGWREEREGVRRTGRVNQNQGKASHLLTSSWGVLQKEWRAPVALSVSFLMSPYPLLPHAPCLSVQSICC